MKKIFVIVLTLLVFGGIQAQNKIRGNGNVTKIIRTTSDYNGIKCGGSFEFVLIAGPEGNIIIEGEENLLQYIRTEVKDGNLIVKIEGGKSLRSSIGKAIKITIPYTDIECVSMAGSGNLRSENKITSNTFRATMAGSGKLSLTVESNSVLASLAGSGDLILNGSTNNLEANVAGSGEFHAFELQSNNTDVSVAGSGDAEVVSNENLKARVTGSGGIKYKGTPTQEDTKVSGSGRIVNH